MTWFMRNNPRGRLTSNEHNLHENIIVLIIHDAVIAKTMNKNFKDFKLLVFSIAVSIYFYCDLPETLSFFKTGYIGKYCSNLKGTYNI